MWTRTQLKEKGKGSFKANYWKAVLVGFILMLITASISVSSSTGTGLVPAFTGTTFPHLSHELGHESAQDIIESYSRELGEMGIDTGSISSEDVVPDENGFSFHGDDGSYVHIDENGIEIMSEDGELYMEHSGTPEGLEMLGPLAVFFIGGAVGLLVLLALVIGFAVDAFLLNPIEVGGCRFFVNNLNRKAEIKELTYMFDNNYLNNVKTMFLRDLFTFLWALLLIIPGIVKSYEYRMIPYLITEHPEMDYKTAFETSKRMMNGQKWNTFVLDLSFIGWWLLSAITLGIVGVFYATPYYHATCAALYEALRYPGSANTAGRQYVDPQTPGAAAAAGQPYNAPDMSQQPSWATANDATSPNAYGSTPDATTPLHEDVNASQAAGPAAAPQTGPNTYQAPQAAAPTATPQAGTNTYQAPPDPNQAAKDAGHPIPPQL